MKRLLAYCLIVLPVLGGSCRPKDEPKRNEPAPKVEMIVKGDVLTSYPNSLIGNTGEVELNKGVAVIGESAFKGCTSLKELAAPGLKEIKVKAFDGCTALSKLTLNTPTPPKADDSAFASTPGNKKLVVPAGSEAAYYDWAKKHGFTSINDAEIPEIKIVEGRLVAYPSVFIVNGEVTLGSEVTAIGEGVFSGSKLLRKISAPGVKTIEARAFAKAEALSEVEFPSLVTIGDNAFAEAKVLTRVTLPAVQNVGNFAFTKAEALTTVRIPAVKSIGNRAFAGCKALHVFEIGGTLPTLGPEAPFEDTPGDKVLTAPETADRDAYEAWAVQHGFKSLNGEAIVDRQPVPDGFEAEGRKITKITDKNKGHAWKVTIPEYFNEIGDKVFYTYRGGSELSTITAPGVVKIGERSFYNVSNLRKVDMPKLKIIGKEAFMLCKSILSKMRWTPAVEVIGDNAFDTCEHLDFVSAPRLKEIGNNAFNGCRRMQSQGTLHLGATPPIIRGGLGIQSIPLLIIPKGSRSAYDQWEHKAKFKKILEEGDPGTEDWSTEMAKP